MLQSADCKSGFSLVNEYLNRSTMLMKQHSSYVDADEVNEDSLIRTIFVGHDYLYHIHDLETFRINSRQCNHGSLEGQKSRYWRIIPRKRQMHNYVRLRYDDSVTSSIKFEPFHYSLISYRLVNAHGVQLIIPAWSTCEVSIFTYVLPAAS